MPINKLPPCVLIQLIQVTTIKLSAASIKGGGYKDLYQPHLTPFGFFLGGGGLTSSHSQLLHAYTPPPLI